jgi:hypothetical protein
MSADYEAIYDTARSHDISPESVVLAEIELRLDEINGTLDRIAEALENTAAWNVHVTSTA